MKLRLVEPGKTPAWQFKARIEGNAKLQILVIELWCDGFAIGARSVRINQPLTMYAAEVERSRAYLISATNAPDDTQ